MSRISREEVERVAALARLSLSEDETERMTHDLDAILDYVETLQELDTSAVEPTSHAIPLPTPMRDDEPSEPMDPRLAIANAPASSDSAFVVPKVLEGEEEG